MKVIRIIPSFLIGLVMLCLAMPVSAQSVPGDIVRAAFLPGWQRADGQHVAGLRLDLKPGWKTYWRVPGEAGIVPRFTLEGPGLTGMRVIWPEPELFSQAGLLGIGYTDQLVVPFVLEGRPRSVEGRVDIGVCNEICVPVSFAIRGRIDGNTTPNPQLLAAMASQPLSGSEVGIAQPSCLVQPNSEGVSVTISIQLAGRDTPGHVVIETGDPRLIVSPRPEMRREGDLLQVTAQIMPPSGSGIALARQDLRLTLLGGGRAVELRGCS